jgi:GntR family transcriptional regulator
LDINMGVTEFIQSLHKEPGVGQMRVTAQAVDDYWSEQLAVPPQSEVVRVERVRLADGEPIIYSVDVLPMAVLRHQAPGITTEDLKGLLVEHMSIYKILETRLGLTIDHGVAILEPTRADEDVARNLEVDVGSLILLLTQTDYDPASDPIMASQEHHRSDACRFTVYRAR